MIKYALAVVLLAALFNQSSSAQVIYQPQIYQYGANPSFFYGGSDWHVFAYANRTVNYDGIAGPVDARYHVGNTLYNGYTLSVPPAVFSDRVPYFNAALFRYTPADARNASNAALPTYFRKIDLLRAALPSRDGMGWEVPAQAPLTPPGQIDIRPYRPRVAPPATAPTTRPADTQPLLIIPKSLLQSPPKRTLTVASN